MARLSVALGGVLTAWVVIGLGLLPPRRTPVPEAVARGPAPPVAAALQATVEPHAEVHRLEGLAWLQASAMPANGDSALWVAVDTALPAPVAGRALDAALGKWRAVHASRTSPTVVIGLLDARHDPHDAPPLRALDTQVFIQIPTDRSTPCLVLAALAGAVIDRAAVLERAPAFTLGACAFYARFGYPGAGVAEWLRDGATALAAEPDWDWPANAPAERAARRAAYAWRLQGPFRGMPLSAARCLAGDERLCRDAVLSPQSPVRTAFSTLDGDAAIVGRPAQEEAWVLADLVRAFGPERFERFWRSEAGVADAFRAAFGPRPEEWYRGWVRTTYGELPAGTRQRPATVIVSLGVLAVLITAGAGLAARRQVA